MSASIETGQHAVNSDGKGRAGAGRTSRTAGGDSFANLVVTVASLGHAFTAKGEALARIGGQTLARWVMLDAVAHEAAPVAQIARRLGQARQSAQRVADLLVADGLASYEPNPSHKRAQLLLIEEPGRRALDAINEAQATWANPLGQAIGIATMNSLIAELKQVREVVERDSQRPARDP